MSQFDGFADDYEAALDCGLSVSGESKDFFAEGRVRWLAHQLEQRQLRVRAILDFGCGTGSATPHLFHAFDTHPGNGKVTLIGVDPSESSLAVARSEYQDYAANYLQPEAYQPVANIDLAFCNGVFHHIPPPEREAAMKYVAKSLRPGGMFALWENNPWNPGTRYVMSKIPFDHDAICLTGTETRRLAQAAGLEVVSVDYQFVFPGPLKALRWIEDYLAKLPVGAQFQTLCRKPTQ